MRCWHADAPMSLADKLRGMSVVDRSVDRRVVTTRLNATTGLRHKVPSFTVVGKTAQETALSRMPHRAFKSCPKHCWASQQWHPRSKVNRGLE
jgi:hypothetical protein